MKHLLASIGLGKGLLRVLRAAGDEVPF